MNAKGTVVVLEGCLGDWSKKSYMENLMMRAGEIELYAVDVRNLEQEETSKQFQKNSVEFINKFVEKGKYNSIEPVDYVFIVAPPAAHCEIAAHWLL
ncbi:MAG: hypothetical protein HXS40_09415, partial [Theionarchaea archaeon]|nr:hypothetical protein [Theionarchaea archaeon]